MGNLGGGAGKGGGAGGSIREAGGSIGEVGAAREEVYFRKKSAEQLKKLKGNRYTSASVFEDDLKKKVTNLEDSAKDKPWKNE